MSENNHEFSAIAYRWLNSKQTELKLSSIVRYKSPLFFFISLTDKQRGRGNIVIILIPFHNLVVRTIFFPVSFTLFS